MEGIHCEVTEQCISHSGKQIGNWRPVDVTVYPKRLDFLKKVLSRVRSAGASKGTQATQNASQKFSGEVGAKIKKLGDKV